MKVTPHEFIVCYDVDGTLVTLGNGNLKIKNPLTASELYYAFNFKHIELLKSHRARGYHVRVWSAAGWQWAEAVVKALHLEEYVNSIETKPICLVDDLPVQEIFPHRVFIKE